MQVDLLTREFPPHVYGGAGVHATELAKVLREKISVTVHCFEGERPGDLMPGVNVKGYDYLPEQSADNAALKTLGVDLRIAQECAGADLVHSHTWYANMAGHWAKLMYEIPHVITAHSLEPLRPWKKEQLAGGYNLSSWAERTAYLGADAVVAVSHGMRADILRCYPEIDPEKVVVIHNGLDLNDWRKPAAGDPAVAATLAEYGIDPTRPTVVFVGRITRQKGLPHLLRALRLVPKETQVVLCAGAPDTKEIAAEVAALVAELQAERDGIIWIQNMLPHDQVVHILSVANVFVTPSIYEPMGIVNLEAAALELPVVGTKTGGIPDCIADGETGYLVPIEQMQDGTGTPLEPAKFEADLAERLTYLIANPTLAASLGQAGRRRVEELFTWDAVAEKVIALYQSVR